MGRKANPAVVGAFVVGAIALAVTGVVVFGSGQLFRDTSEWVCMFTGTVDGLNVGAPVKFKGVEIGSVVDVRLRLEGQAVPDAMDLEKGYRIPVIIELDNKKLIGRGALGAARPERMKELIKSGMRAQLATQSFVTGLLFVQLDFMPDKPAEFVLGDKSEYPEIPTVPTALEQVQSAAQQLVNKLEDVNVEELMESVRETVDGIKKVVNSPALQATIDALPATVANVNRTVDSAREVTTGIARKEGPLLDSLKGTSDQTGVTMEQARATLQSLQLQIEPNAPLPNQLTASLQELVSAARAVRLLADYLERNPGALVRGRAVEGE